MPRFIWLLPVIIILALPCVLQAQKRSAIRTVVIDAGHGGHDPGATGQLAREKNINLAIALKLGNLIQRTMKDVRVIYTRDKDYFVELYRRAEIANENKADLFICIHCNANNDHLLKGAETYVMGLHKSQANLEVAKFENAAILLESDYQSTYNGFDPNADESYIVFSLNQNSNLEQSTDFAAGIQSQMEERVGMNNRGVRQAGFIVLYKTAMPSVLVEVGYISNPNEEKFLVSDKGQEYIASAIFRAFKSFRESVANSPSNKETTIKSYVPAREATKVNDFADDTAPVVQRSRRDRANIDLNNKSGEISYRVQIAVTTQDIGVNAPEFSTFRQVKMYRHGGMYKYTVGDESTLNNVQRILDQVKSRGFKDAFIVIFRNGERIPQNEADRLLGK
ncbi:MAG: N-acetylmuramoyl-L-alanine amidase [Bacteroidota bacterium]